MKKRNTCCGFNGRCILWLIRFDRDAMKKMYFKFANSPKFVVYIYSEQ